MKQGDPADRIAFNLLVSLPLALCAGTVTIGSGEKHLLVYVLCGRRATGEGLREKADPSMWELIATCAGGLEALLAAELKDLGCERVRPLQGQVSFYADLAGLYRVCLCSRLASRVLFVLGRGPAKNADELYESARTIAWQEHIPSRARLAVRAKGTNAALKSETFSAQRIKDSIADQLFEHAGFRPEVDLSHPDLVIDARISGERVRLAMDLSGDPLFYRGSQADGGSGAQGARSGGSMYGTGSAHSTYGTGSAHSTYGAHSTRGIRSARAFSGPVLRRDYAAAVLYAAGFTPAAALAQKIPSELAFLFPTSLALEASAIAAGKASGISRSRWGFDLWALSDAALFYEIRSALVAAEHSCSDFNLYLCEWRKGATSAVLQTLRQEGLDCVCYPQLPDKTPELLFCDLSWVEEESFAMAAKGLASLADLRSAKTVCLSSLGSELALDVALGRAPTAVIPVMLGAGTQEIRFYGAAPELSPVATVHVASEIQSVLLGSSEQFCARFSKMARLRGKWARREDIHAYRIYDLDLPDYALSVELYESVPGRERGGRHNSRESRDTRVKKHLLISEYTAPKEIDPARAQARLADAVNIASAVCGVAPEHITLRRRSHSKGGSQYADYAADKRRHAPAAGQHTSAAGQYTSANFVISEGGLAFALDFSGHLDCGIFLDHRLTRAYIRETMKSYPAGSFLNLFAYTGTSTVYAADGGAAHTTTVDLSASALERARKNMELNGFSGPEHIFVRADVLRWVREARLSQKRWDLIFCDVPTFSNSAAMRKKGFDVQRDHAELIISISRLLRSGGLAVFSCNLKKFRLDTEALAKAGVFTEDITAKTIPEDFSRNPQVHHCYLVRRA